MICRKYSNKEIKLNWNPMELLRKRCEGLTDTNFPPVSRIIHIEIMLNCRLLPAFSIPCLNIANALNISNWKNYCRKNIHPSFRQRAIESNQFDNLSPPLFPITVVRKAR